MDQSHVRLHYGNESLTVHSNYPRQIRRFPGSVDRRALLPDHKSHVNPISEPETGSACGDFL